MQTQREVPVMEVKMKLLGELEAVGFPRARAVRALHHSGNTSLDAAVNWLIDHENDADIDQMPLVAINLDIESPQPSDITEAIKIKEQELRFDFDYPFVMKAFTPFSRQLNSFYLIVFPKYL
ncbi:hypothetical protein SCA6_014229 [Theobroma cacao]